MDLDSLFFTTLLDMELEDRGKEIVLFNKDYWAKYRDVYISKKGAIVICCREIKPEGRGFDKYQRMAYINIFVALLNGVKYPFSIVDKGQRLGFVYFIKTPFGTKIGYSKKPEKRITNIIKELPFKEIETSYLKVYDLIIAEYCLHRIFYDKHITGEWFDLTEDDIKKGSKYLKEKHNGKPYESQVLKNRFVKLGTRNKHV